MPYTRQTWLNDAVGNTPISANRLNHIEQGIYDATGSAEQAENDASIALASASPAATQAATADANASLAQQTANSAIPRATILGKGELTKKLTVQAHAISPSALEKIEKAGGSFEII